MNRLYINKDWSTLKKLLAMNAASGGATPKTETLSGSLVTFSTKKALPLIDCKAEINPVQDLHGYEHPWPAGGGVNILPPLRVSEVTRNGIIFKSDGNGTYSLSGTASTSVSLAITLDEPITYTAGTYYMSVLNNAFGGLVGFYGVQNSTNVWDIVINANNKTQQITFAADTTITALSVYIGNGSTVNFTFSPVLSKTGFVQAFAPYSNICPITGWTGAKVYRVGKNLLDIGTISLGGQNSRTKDIYFDTPIPTGTYSFSYAKAGDATSYGIELFGASGRVAAFSSANPVTRTITDQAIRMYIYINSTQYREGKTLQIDNIQLELGSTATAYEPYQGNTYDIEFPTEAGTVYGGSLDVTNGVLTVDRASVLMSAFDFSLFSSQDRNVFRATYSDVLPDIISHSNQDAVYGDICDRYTYKAYGPIAQNDDGKFAISPISTNRLVVIDHRFSSTSDFQEAVNDVQLVYKLATPITYQLTPQEITTLIGTNNVWADTGDVTVTYYK